MRDMDSLWGCGCADTQSAENFDRAYEILGIKAITEVQGNKFLYDESLFVFCVLF